MISRLGTEDHSYPRSLFSSCLSQGTPQPGQPDPGLPGMRPKTKGRTLTLRTFLAVTRIRQSLLIAIRPTLLRKLFMTPKPVHPKKRRMPPKTFGIILRRLPADRHAESASMLYILIFFLISEVCTGRRETPTPATGTPKSLMSMQLAARRQRFEAISKGNTSTTIWRCPRRRDGNISYVLKQGSTVRPLSLLLQYRWTVSTRKPFTNT